MLQIKLYWTPYLVIVAVLIVKTFGLPQILNSKDTRIINGSLATLNNTKHQVSFRSRAGEALVFGMGHLCGGSLISENVVLSAAHCFINQEINNGSFRPDSDFVAVMGNLDRLEKNNNTLVFDILKVVKYHEILNVDTYDQDIVLVILNGTVPADHPTIQPIILNDAPLDGGTMCQVTGWGLNEYGNVSEVLMSADVPFIPFEVCRNYSLYRDSLHEGMLCAGYFEGGRDSCQGDSGGPLVCDGHQAGIVSWGLGCAEVLRPGIYTNVAFYKNWILAKVSEHNATLPKFAGNNTSGGGNNIIGNGSMSLSNCSMLLISFLVAVNEIFHKMLL